MTKEDLLKTQETLHAHAFWLYGIIAGLAIKEALSVVVPHVLAFLAPGAKVDAGYNRTLVGTEVLRLFVFLVVVVRFYVGSAFFFQSAHVSTRSKEPIKPSDYGKDFISGLLHFLLFFVWSFSIDILNTAAWLFPAIMCGILLYDMLWLLVCRHVRTQPLLIFWTALNVTTVIFGVITYAVVRSLWPARPLLAEGGVLCIVLAASWDDLRVMLMRAGSASDSYLWPVVRHLYTAFTRLKEPEVAESAQG